MINLRTKIFFIIIVTLTIFTLILGFYFDIFLKEESYTRSKDQIFHAVKRVVADFKRTEKELREGISFVKNDVSLIASMELINNYQDKNDYNSILLDEEKKEIVKYLLEKIKVSFNSGIKLYDKNEELIAYVYQEGKRYKLNFISYKNGKRVLYWKYENDMEYTKTNYIENSLVPYKHVNYYMQPELKSTIPLTSVNLDNQIVITSHQSVFLRDNTEKTIMHLEMNKVFHKAYFEQVGHELDVKISLTKESQYEKKSLALFDDSFMKKDNIVQTQDNYTSAFVIKTKKQDTYILFTLDKEVLKSILMKNRQQLIIFLIIATIALLVIFNVLMHLGIINPLSKLMQQISKIKNGDYSTSNIVKTADEFEEISKNINMLAASVDNREASLIASKNQLEHFSTHDELTGLLNRRSFSLKLEYALQQAQRKRTKVAVLFLDLDDFKQVNDTLGHSIGDKLLKAVADRLQMSLRKSDVFARVGGDEFNIFVDAFKTIGELQVFAQKILDDFIEPFVDSHNEIVSSTSIGIALFPDDGEDVETLIKNADLAMYKSKERGRNGYSFYASKFSEQVQCRMNIVQALKSAIKNQDEFVLYYQPKVSIKTQKVVGMEALIRWNSPELGFMSPDEFIQIAEDTHMIIDIGNWVIKQACDDFMSLEESGYHLEQISINISGVQLEYSDLLAKIKEVIKLTKIPTNKLELEVTESYIATNEKNAIEILSKFRDMGIELAIDDFGTGYSSLSYLQALPISRLKIDKTFVDDLPHSKGSVAVVNTIIALAESFDLKVTVEGVELKEQLDFFVDKPCDDIQGYYYSKPLCFSDLKEFLK